MPLAGATWFVLMPEHGRFHFIPRHFFVPCVLFAVIMCDLICRGLNLKTAGADLEKIIRSGVSHSSRCEC